MVFCRYYHTKITLQDIVRAPMDMYNDMILLRKLLSAQLNSLGECTLPIMPSKEAKITDDIWKHLLGGKQLEEKLSLKHMLTYTCSC
jgi:hypothetical protein